jgi:1-acyl-sn-glycerol-3-phosphate acyltransferase
MQPMSGDRFAEIRPYHDDEVRGVLDRLLANRGLLAAIAELRFPRANRWIAPVLHPLVRLLLGQQVRGVASVREFQRVVERYMRRMVESTTTAFTVSGLDDLDPGRPCLFIGNHRDIALDPAFINFALYCNARETVRIAIGDNLLTRDYVSDLMRLNKSFIVRRSAKGPRQMLAAYQELSAYVRHSLLAEHSPVWIAQREGRAKDGWDRTEPAIIKMLAISKPKDMEFAEHVRALGIVPVAISYQWDPCDAGKARELHQRAVHGSYEKTEQEDVNSIARSVTAAKGRVHVSFGSRLEGELGTPEAVAQAIDRQIVGGYHLHDTNFCAFRLLEGRLPAAFAGEAAAADAVEPAFRARLDALPAEQRPFLLAMYANPLRNRLELEA